MPSTKRTVRRAVLVLTALSLAFATAGCETLDKMNPFQEKEKKLPGARTTVFPEGVPGVDYNAAPPQPANSTHDFSSPGNSAASGAAASNPAQ